MSQIAAAVAILRRGGLVAFPTETVYGLGADATNAAAVRRIFAAKGRPITNPLIVHVADEAVARRYAAEWPAKAHKLAAHFWPGPLTLVVPKSAHIVVEATAGLETVGLRCPDHPLALRLLRQFDGPVAAPSANRSTRISPTTAEHVRHELGDAVDVVLDGGPCRVGIESTVLDLCGRKPRILRPGGILQSQIEKLIGPIEAFEPTTVEDAPAMSPGQQAVHYAPEAAAFRFGARGRRKVLEWCGAHVDDHWAVLVIGDAKEFALLGALSADGRHHIVEMPTDAEEYARRLYATMRELDRRGVKTMWIEMPPTSAAWTAVRDRLRRATKG